MHSACYVLIPGTHARTKTEAERIARKTLNHYKKEEWIDFFVLGGRFVGTLDQLRLKSIAPKQYAKWQRAINTTRELSGEELVALFEKHFAGYEVYSRTLHAHIKRMAHNPMAEYGLEPDRRRKEVAIVDELLYKQLRKLIAQYDDESFPPFSEGDYLTFSEWPAVDPSALKAKDVVGKYWVVVGDCHHC